MPSIAVSRSYEAIYILDPDSSDEQIATTTTRYKTVVETAGGTVEKLDVWERRRLAYPVKGRTEGIYVVMNFDGIATVEAELRRVFQISEDQIRYMIVKPEDVEPLLPIQESAPVAEAAAPVAAVVENSAVEAGPSVDETIAPAEAEEVAAEPVVEATEAAAA